MMGQALPQWPALLAALQPLWVALDAGGHGLGLRKPLAGSCGAGLVETGRNHSCFSLLKV